jgi:hypothetical protein
VWELVLTAALLTVCIGARVPYAPLLLVLFLPAMEAEARGWRRFAGPTAAVMAGAAVVLAWQRAVRPLGVFVGPGARLAEQTAYLKTHLVTGTLWIIGGTLRELPGLGIKAVDVLGANDVFAPGWVYVLLVAGIAGVLLLRPGRGLQTRAARLLLAGVLAAIVFGMSAAEYMIWTPVASHRVLGLQSRYYLPLLPFMLLLIKAPLERIYRWRFRQTVCFAAGVIFVAAVLSTPWTAARRFYGVGMMDALQHTLR